MDVCNKRYHYVETTHITQVPPGNQASCDSYITQQIIQIPHPTMYVRVCPDRHPEINLVFIVYQVCIKYVFAVVLSSFSVVYTPRSYHDSFTLGTDHLTAARASSFRG